VQGHDVPEMEDFFSFKGGILGFGLGAADPGQPANQPLHLFRGQVFYVAQVGNDALLHLIAFPVVFNQFYVGVLLAVAFADDFTEKHHYTNFQLFFSANGFLLSR